MFIYVTGLPNHHASLLGSERPVVHSVDFDLPVMVDYNFKGNWHLNSKWLASGGALLN